MERMKAILVLVAAITFAIAPFVTTDFNGFDPGLFPVPQDNPPAQPAGYAFAIWGLIYVWLIVHAGYGLLRRDEDRGWDAPRWPLFISLGVGASWLAVANTSPILATIQIFVMLLAALWALFLSPRGDRWLAQAPMAVYAGWLSAASFVSLALLLAGYGVTSERAAALIVLPVAVLFALAVQWRLGRAPEYAATVIWALVAIVVANWGSAWAVPFVAAAGALALAAMAVRVERGPQ